MSQPLSSSTIVSATVQDFPSIIIKQGDHVSKRVNNVLRHLRDDGIVYLTSSTSAPSNQKLVSIVETIKQRLAQSRELYYQYNRLQQVTADEDIHQKKKAKVDQQKSDGDKKAYIPQLTICLATKEQQNKEGWTKQT